MKLIDTFSRYFVGVLFIFSGLVKLNDPIGTKIKLEEYFEVFATDFAPFFELLIPAALPLGLILVVLEIVLGIAVLLHYRMNVTTWILLLLILFFTFLTFYSAYFDKVTDCGCFGDAIPLDPWQSFFKDVVLIVFIAHLFWYRRQFLSSISLKAGHITIISATVVSFLVGIYAIEHLPYLDFRSYKIGNNIPALMQSGADPIIEYTFIKGGEEVRSQQYLSEDDGYAFVGSKVLNEDETMPKIQDYYVTTPTGEDYTLGSLEGLKVIVVTQGLKTLRYSKMEELSGFIQSLEGRIEVIALTSILEDDFENLRHEYQLAVPFYFVDSTVLKAMVRSNPGILLIQDGTVLGKWHINDLPDAGEIAGLI